ncbi:Fe-S cluster assembly protein SufD [Paenibacillus urinalis]|uniref:Fe-S cluster assembly protein SufD n=1 Tax=Paenibacillus urinalis TaxID=521520 RepID=A0AAX3N3N9_9BACL|nr:MULTISPECIES: Fe-S cluster assembly protein SufD [Paenibacillus]WDH84237.1 Fe-S cluster assembly protein SufD [Paenibacillus urinalis]WDH95680.1 Fe-S cluster assembly protein SufD [Paenibacillus urinalis]WDI03877.1 Fe-S cluster assembly protein SufD [Paenibacillus urinalis]GAK38778.1 ABC transporter permease protein [Paenibacillus sp. TCA20]
MTTQTILPVDSEALRALSEGRNEPAWLSEGRQAALDLAGNLALPKLEKTKIERWNLSAYGQYKTSDAITLNETPEAIASLIKDEQDGTLLIQRGSSVVYSNLSKELADQGVIFTDLETAVREHEDLVKSHLHTAVKSDEHQLAALHTAIWNGGVFLYVPRNVVIEKPVQAILLAEDGTATFAPHVLIIADTNSSVVYVDNYVSGNLEAPVFHNGVAEVFVKPGAKVRFATVHQFGDQVTDITYRRAVVENDGTIEWIVGEMNTGNTASDTLSILKGNGSNSDQKTIAVGAGSQKLNYTTQAKHFGKSSASQMITRAVMREEASAIINGITKIEHGATKADGQQTERVLMLSPKARGDANPILLIDEDDVTAGHAASVGQVNQEQIYYLMSRGISRENAERLIIYGFLAPVVSDIPLEELQVQLQSLVERKLGQ